MQAKREKVFSTKLALLVVLHATILFLPAFNLRAQSPELKAQLGERSTVLVGLAAASNIGSKDPDCRGVKFEVLDIDSLVDTELLPIWMRISERDKTVNVNGIIVALKSASSFKKDGRLLSQTLYEHVKQQAFDQVGKEGACARVTALIRATIQDVRLSIKEISNKLPSQ